MHAGGTVCMQQLSDAAVRDTRVISRHGRGPPTCTLRTAARAAPPLQMRPQLRAQTAPMMMLCL